VEVNDVHRWRRAAFAALLRGREKRLKNFNTIVVPWARDVPPPPKGRLVYPKRTADAVDYWLKKPAD
jgi:hypothetical protein